MTPHPCAERASPIRSVFGCLPCPPVPALSLTHTRMSCVPPIFACRVSPILQVESLSRDIVVERDVNVTMTQVTNANPYPKPNPNPNPNPATTQRLNATIGNGAHDLKSPCTSLRLAVEVRVTAQQPPPRDRPYKVQMNFCH